MNRMNEQLNEKRTNGITPRFLFDQLQPRTLCHRVTAVVSKGKGVLFPASFHFRCWLCV